MNIVAVKICDSVSKHLQWCPLVDNRWFPLSDCWKHCGEIATVYVPKMVHMDVDSDLPVSNYGLLTLQRQGMVTNGRSQKACRKIAKWFSYLPFHCKRNMMLNC